MWDTLMGDSVLNVKGTCLASDRMRLQAWLRARYHTTAAQDVISVECQDDMDMQDMSARQDLFGLELCIFLGRAVSASELKGGAYGSPATSMDGAVRAKKSSANVQSHNIDQIIAKAVDTGETQALERHWTDLAHRISVSKLLPYNGVGATRVLTFHQKAKDNMATDLGYAIYMAETRQKYQGRGLPLAALPTLFDSECAIKAQNLAMKLGMSRGLPQPGSGTVSQISSSWDTSSLSSLGESASQVGPGASIFVRL